MVAGAVVAGAVVGGAVVAGAVASCGLVVVGGGSVDGTITTIGLSSLISDAPTSSLETPPGAALPMTRLEQYQTPPMGSQSILGSEQVLR